MKLCEYSASELSVMLEKKQISSAELTMSVLERINAVDKKLNAYITVCAESALASARTVDEKRIKGEKLSELAGIPIGIKDNIAVKDIKMTCGSQMLENYISAYSAAVVERLQQSGAVIIGKLNMDEFAMGSSTESSYFGVTVNPFDTSKVAGGSSGGCAAAVSAGEAILAIASDTGGSIRQPASFCGIVGLKPTYGSVSRYGLTAFASSFDQIGPMGRTVRDTGMLLRHISGYDKRDSTSVDRQYTDLSHGSSENIEGIRIGVPRELFEDIAAPDILDSFDQSVDVLKDCGAIVSDISIDCSELALPAYYVISSAEASSNLARFDGIRYGLRAQNYKDLGDMYVKTRSQGFGDECKRRIMLGTFVLSAGYYDNYYKKALSAARFIKNSVKKQFETIDIIAMPTSPETAFEVGAKLNDPVRMYKSDIFTVFANLAGVPAISVPCGVDANGLPIGLQLMADSFCEKELLDCAYAYESAVGGFIRPHI